MKTCNKCNKEKEECEFHKLKCSMDGLYHVCKACRKENYNKNKQKTNQYYVDNKIKITERHLQYYIKNKEKISDWRKEYNHINKKDISSEKRQYYQDNPEKREQRDNWHKQYRHNNKEKIREYGKQSYQKNKEKIKLKTKQNKLKNRNRYNQYFRVRTQKDPLFKLIRNVRCLIYVSLRGQGYSKKSKTQDILGCSFEDLMKHLGLKPEGDIHLDHICPCSQAQSEDELLKLQHYSNLRWLTSSENLSKSASWSPEAEEMCRRLLGREWI